jgi:hypothetical protein
MDRDKHLTHHHRIEEAEAVIHDWILEFIDHDRPQCPPMTALDLVDHLRAQGWQLVPVCDEQD